MKNIKNKFEELVGTHPVVVIFCATLVIHICAVIIFNTVHISFLSATGDNLLYNTFATQIAQLLHAGTYHLGDIYPHHWYPLFVGIIFYITGPSMMIGSFVNAIISASTAVVIYKLFKEYSVPKKIAFWGSLVITNTYASFLYHSSILLKESWIVFLLVAIIYLARRTSQGRGNRFALFGIMAVAWILLRNLRFFIGFSAIALFFAEWFLNANLSIKRKIGYGVIVLVIANIFTRFLSGDGLFHAPSILSLLNRGYINQIRDASELAFSASHIRIFDFSGHIMWSQVIKAFGVAMFGPFPGQLSTSRYIIALTDTIFVYSATAVACWGLFKNKLTSWKTYLPLVIATVILVISVTIGTDNIGANIRQRISPVVVIAVIAVITYSDSRKKYEQV